MIPTFHRFNKSEKLNDYSPQREGIYCGKFTIVETSRRKALFVDEETQEVILFESLQEAKKHLVEEMKKEEI